MRTGLNRMAIDYKMQPPVNKHQFTTLTISKIEKDVRCQEANRTSTKKKETFEEIERSCKYGRYTEMSRPTFKMRSANSPLPHAINAI